MPWMLRRKEDMCWKDPRHPGMGGDGTHAGSLGRAGTGCSLAFVVLVELELAGREASVGAVVVVVTGRRGC